MPGAEPVVGVHIRSGHIQVVRAARLGSSWPATLIESLPVSEGEVSGDLVVDPRAVGAALANLWRELRLPAREVVASVPSSQCILFHSDGERLPPKMEQQIGAPLSDYHADVVMAEPAGEAGSPGRFLHVLVSRRALNALTTALSIAGLKPVAVDLDIAAMARAVRYAFVEGRTVPGIHTVIDIGRRESTVAVFSPGGPMHRHVLPVGVAVWTEEVSARCGDSLDVATQRLFTEGVEPASRLRAMLDPSLSLLQWGMERARLDNPLPSVPAPWTGAFLCGEGAAIPGLSQVVDESLPPGSLASQPIYVMRRPGMERPATPDSGGGAGLAPACACAYGLAMWPVDPP